MQFAMMRHNDEHGFGMSEHMQASPRPKFGLKHPYHLVDPSPWPIVGALGAGSCIGARHHPRRALRHYVLLVIGCGLVLAIMFFWWRDVINESRTPGLHTPVVQLGLRYGMALFIASR